MATKKKLLCLILAVLFVLTAFPFGALAEEETVSMDDYKLVTESDTYKLYLYEPTMSIKLENKETGVILESTLSDEKDNGKNNSVWTGYMKSGIVLQFIKGTNNTYQADLLNNANTLNYTYKPNGFSCDIFFTKEMFGLTVNVTLERDELIVTVPDSSIREEGENTYISTVSLFPFMGYTHMGDTPGYMFIPDGNGALIYLDDKEGRFTTGFSQLIYGRDDGFTDTSTPSYLWDEYDTVIRSNNVLAPIFGIAHTEEKIGFLGIVESGDKRASIEAQPNGAMVDYNRCFAKFVLRDVYVQPLNQSNSGTVQMVENDRGHDDLTVRYCLLSGDNANYVGMAVKYRSYLLASGAIQKKDTTYKTRVDFLGTDREPFLVSTTAVVMTTVDQIKEIYTDLRMGGVPSLLTVYKGWQKGGYYALPINSFDADGAIGGTNNLAKLIEEEELNDFTVYLYNDALRINGTTNKFTMNAVKKVNKRTLMETPVKQVYDLFYYQMPNRTDSTLKNFLQSYTKKGVRNLALAGITNTLFSYSSKGSFYTRKNTADVYENTVNATSANTNLVLEQPFAYLWRYTDGFLDMPVGSSDYMFVNEEVPFLSIVLKGVIPMYSAYVNFEANKTEFFLQLVESGVYPSFYVTHENSSKLIYTNSSDLYSTEYKTYRDTIVEYDRALRLVQNAVDGATIVNHEKLDNGVTRVTYSNGVRVYVNYSEKDVSIDGYTVEALSYKVGEAQ